MTICIKENKEDEALQWGGMLFGITGFCIEMYLVLEFCLDVFVHSASQPISELHGSDSPEEVLY